MSHDQPPPFRNLGSSYPFSDAEAVAPMPGNSNAPRGPRPPRSKRGILILAGAVAAGLLIVFCGGLGTIVYLASTSTVAVEPHGDPAALRAEAVAAFNGFHADDEPSGDETRQQEQREIERVFRQLERAAAIEDDGAFNRLVDRDRFFARILATGRLEDWNALERRELKRQLANDDGDYMYWHRIVVVSVVPGQDADTRVVYTFAYNAQETEEAEYRWWFSQRDGEWKFYDWERLDIALSESEEWSLSAKYVDTTPWTIYERFADKLTTGRNASESGDQENAEQHLRAANPVGSPRELLDTAWLLLGYAWNVHGDPKEAIKCFDQVKRPDDAPGAHLGRMVSLESLGQWEGALASAEKYEAVIGHTPDVLRTKARCLAQLKRTDDEIAARKRLLRIEPDREANASDLLVCLPDDRKAEMLTWLDAATDPADKASKIAQQVFYSDFASFEFLRQYVQGKEPESAASARFDGMILNAEGDYPAAADAYRLAMDRAATDEEREEMFNAYLTAMAGCGRLIEAYEAAPDPVETFDSIAWQFDDGSIEITGAEFEQLIARHRERFPEDLNSVYFVAQRALDDERFADAEQLARDGLALPAGDEENEYVADYLKSILTTALTKQGKPLDAYEQGSGREGTFNQIANLLLEQESWDELTRLVELHAARQPDDDDLEFFRGKLAEHDGNAALAIAHYRKAISAVTETGSLYNTWRPRAALIDLAVKSDRWEGFYNAEPDKNQAFTQLMRRFSGQADFGNLERLFDRHRLESPNDPDLLDAEAKFAWDRHDFEQCAERSAAAAAAWEAADSSWEQKRSRDRQLRALGRLGRFNDARRVATDISGNGSHEFLAIVEAMAGNDDDALQAALQFADADGSAWSLYNHADAGPRFHAAAFRPLHERMPVVVNYRYGRISVAAFYDDVPSLDAGEVERAARQALSNGASSPPLVQSVELTGDNVTDAFVVAWGDDRLVVMIGNRPYGAIPASASSVSEEVRARTAAAKGWLAVVGVAIASEESTPLDDDAARLCGALCFSEVAAAAGRPEPIGLFSPQLPGFAPNDSSLRETLAAPDAYQQFSRVSVKTHVDSEDDDVDPDDEWFGGGDVAVWRSFQTDLSRTLRSHHRDEIDRLAVRVSISIGLGEEPVWMRVTKVERDYGWTVRGELAGGSKIVPFLTNGLLMAVSPHDINAFRVGDDEVRERSPRDDSLTRGEVE